MSDYPFWSLESFSEWRRSDKSDEDAYNQIMNASKYQHFRGHSLITSALISWAVALHMDNDQYWYDNVTAIKKSFGKDGKWDAVEAIQEFVEDPDSDFEFSNPFMRQSRDARQLLRQELMTKAEGAINWEEIYDNIEVDWSSDEAVAVGLHGGESEDEPEADTED